MRVMNVMRTKQKESSQKQIQIFQNLRSKNAKAKVSAKKSTRIKKPVQKKDIKAIKKSLRKRKFVNGRKKEAQQQLRMKQKEQQQQKLHEYLSAIQFLQNPSIPENTKTQLTSLSNLISLTQCPICYNQYNLTLNRPLIICKNQKDHKMCSKCINQETNFKNMNRCYICRRKIKVSQVKEDQKLIQWMEMSQELGISIPKDFQFIPKEVHQSLRKVSEHQFLRLDSLREKLRQRDCQDYVLRLKLHAKYLSQKIEENKMNLDSIKLQIDRSKSIYEMYLDEFHQARYLAKSIVDSSMLKDNIIFDSLDQLKDEFIPLFSRIVSIYQQCTNQFKDTLKVHQTQDHPEKSYIRDIDDYFCYNSGTDQALTFIRNMNDFSCRQCQIYISEKRTTILNLDRQRGKLLKKLHLMVSKKLHILLQGIISFTPKSFFDFNKLRENLFMVMQKNQTENIQKEIFLNQKDKLRGKMKLILNNVSIQNIQNQEMFQQIKMEGQQERQMGQ